MNTTEPFRPEERQTAEAPLLTGSQALIESFLREGVETLFGYPGGAIIPVYDALYDYRDRLRHILVRHEQGAVHAAQGYARVSGRVGVCLVTSGPGATNTVTDEVSSLGSNYVDAYVWRQEVGSSLTINDLRKWAQENEYVEAVAPVNTGDAKGKAGSSSDSISLYGTMPAFADINGLTIEYGRFLKNTDVDNSSRVCVLSKQASAKKTTIRWYPSTTMAQPDT